MYAIVREGCGEYYTSMVFGFYDPEYDKTDSQSFSKRFWIVLNRSKSALVKMPALQPDSNCLLPTLLVVDSDQSGWDISNKTQTAAGFLPAAELPAMVESNAVPCELLQKCIQLDRACQYEEYRQVRNEKDIRDLDSLSCGFHDAYISEMKHSGDCLYLLLDGIWGCRLELWFEGDVSCDISARNPEKYDPYWFCATVFFHDGFVYLVDGMETTADEITEDSCWFRAKAMKYRAVPV